MTRSKQRQILAIVATDKTFVRSTHREQEVWNGKCIHCNRRLIVSATGEPISQATIEHIVPRNHGGTNDLDNLALACARCNSEKGIRHDVRKARDPKLREIIERLQTRRRDRWREPAQ